MSVSTKEELLEEVNGLAARVRELKHLISTAEQSRCKCPHDHLLYQNLLHCQPQGIYRVRFFPDDHFPKDAHGSLKFPPFLVEMLNDRFCEIINVTREDFVVNPDIVAELAVTEEKDLFMKRNEEAFVARKAFSWEGRFSVDSKIKWLHFESIPRPLANGDIVWTGILYDISARKKREQEMQETIDVLNCALQEIRILKGIFPICVYCKKIRNAEGYWEDVDSYISNHTNARFTHSICPDCAEALYPEFTGSDSLTGR